MLSILKRVCPGVVRSCPGLTLVCDFSSAPQSGKKHQLSYCCSRRRYQSNQKKQVFKENISKDNKFNVQIIIITKLDCLRYQVNIYLFRHQIKCPDNCHAYMSQKQWGLPGQWIWLPRGYQIIRTIFSKVEKHYGH